MLADAFSGWVAASLLIGLRIAPALAFSPPFSLVPTPAIFRVLLGFGLAAVLVGSQPDIAQPLAAGAPPVQLAPGELMIGASLALALQLAFAALYTAGRTIDIQAGYGLALLIDPGTRNQTPLFGTVLAFAAGAIFVTTQGPEELVRVFAASVRAAPLGSLPTLASLPRLTQYISTVFAVAFGVAGGVIASLFLTDLAIALMSRTLPQMNVLVLGLQVKTFVTLITAPVVVGASGSLLFHLLRLAFEAMPGLV